MTTNVHEAIEEHAKDCEKKLIIQFMKRPSVGIMLTFGITAFTLASAGIVAYWSTESDVRSDISILQTTSVSLDKEVDDLKQTVKEIRDVKANQLVIIQKLDNLRNDGR